MHARHLILAELTADRLYVWKEGCFHEAVYADVKQEIYADVLDVDSLKLLLLDIKQQWKNKYNSILSLIDYFCIIPKNLISMRTYGVTEIRHAMVASYEMDEVYRSARHIGLPQDYLLYYAHPLCYEIDQHLRVLDPVGLAGKRLEGHFHLVALNKAVVSNFQVAFKKSGISLGFFVIKPLILQYMPWALSQEKQCQRLLVDLSSNGCVVSFLDKDVCRFVAVHPMHDSLLDKDLMSCLDVSQEEAYRIRVELPKLHRSQLIKRHSHGHDLQLVAEVLQSRAYEMAEELFKLIEPQIRLDQALSIEVCADIEDYWRHCLQTFFENADITFYSRSNSQSATALESYLKASKKEVLAVNDWRQWWTRCKNWIEYHL